ncbi:hypothetical protein N7489_006128, partial [Penicillium chrysogenum]
FIYLPTRDRNLGYKLNYFPGFVQALLHNCLSLTLAPLVLHISHELHLAHSTQAEWAVESRWTTGHRHVTPGSSRLLNTKMAWNGRQSGRTMPDIVTFPGKAKDGREVVLNLENCQCPKCIHPDTMQRISDTFSIPQNVKIESIEHNDNMVEIKSAGSDNHLGLYSYDWLYAHAQSDVYISKTNPVSYPTRIRYVTQSQRVKIRE